MEHFDQILRSYTFLHCLDICMQNGDEASPSINPSSCGNLVKMLITVELAAHGIFLSKFAY